MALLGRLWRVLSDLGAIAVDLGSNLVDLGVILIDLGSIFVDLGLEFGPSQGSILVLLRRSFAQVGRIARGRAEPHFDSVWASPNEVRRFRSRVKNQRKMVLDTLLAQVTQQLVCERRLFRVRTSQNGPQELCGAP